MKSVYRLSLLLALATVAVSAQAQSGCANSPENPTAILGLVGAGGAAFAMFRDRLRARRSR